MPSFLKLKTEKPLALGPNPHIHAGQSITKIIWGTITALIPIVSGSLFFFGWNTLRIYFVSIISGLAFEFLFQLLTAQKTRIHDGSTVLMCLLFSFLMPPAIPSVLILIGIFITIVLTKEFFGGLGRYLFHPVLVGYACLLVLFPNQFMAARYPASHMNWIYFFKNETGLLGTGSIFLILVTGLFLTIKRMIRWENVFFYLAFCTVGLYLTDFSFKFLFSDGFLLLTAFFLITDSTTSPITRTGRITSSTFAAFLTVALSSWMNLHQAVVSSVLISNSLVPLMDYFIVLKNEPEKSF